MSPKKQAVDGDIIQIRLREEKYAFGQVFGGTYAIALFDFCGDCDSRVDEIITKEIFFKERFDPEIVRGGRWKIIGNAELSEKVLSIFELCSCTEYPPSSNNPTGLVLWSIEKYNCQNNFPNEVRGASAQECKEIREGNTFVGAIEDDLRKHFLGMEPLGLTDEIKKFYRSLTPGIPAVVGEFGPLNNDDAYSWLSMVKESEDLSLLKQALLEGRDGDFLDIPEANFMLAAAELVLALLGRARGGVKTFAGQWVQQIKRKKLHQSDEAKTLLPLAIEAIDRVLADNSHLAQELQEQDKWLKGVADLQNKLRALT